MPFTLILSSALYASMSHALPVPDAGPQAHLLAARDMDLHARVDRLLGSNELRLMLFQADPGPPDFVTYALKVHPIVPTELAAHFVIALARLEAKFAKRHQLEVRPFRADVDRLLKLAGLNLSGLDAAAIAHHRPGLDARLAAAFAASVRVLPVPRIPGGAPALSRSFYANLAIHLDRVVAAVWPERETPVSIDEPVLLVQPDAPKAGPIHNEGTMGLLRQALNLDACASAFEVSDEDAVPLVPPAAAD